jgi:hypothetical protein
LLWREAASGVGVTGSAPLRQGRRFFFVVETQISKRARAIPWEISLRNVEGPESGARRELNMGNGGRFEARKQRLFPSAIALNRCSARDRAVSHA